MGARIARQLLPINTTDHFGARGAREVKYMHADDTSERESEAALDEDSLLDRATDPALSEAERTAALSEYSARFPQE